MLRFLYCILYVALAGLGLACGNDKTLFSRVPVSESGIDFSNRIRENDTLNILDFEYIYNGGGVGIADMNGDSLPDVLFSGNQADSRIYLNRGNMKFEDISKKAGISNVGRWCSGISLVDINADGRMDIYLTSTAKKPKHNAPICSLLTRVTMPKVFRLLKKWPKNMVLPIKVTP